MTAGRAEVVLWLRGIFAKVLELDLDSIDPGVRFRDLGLDSMRATMLTARLGKALDRMLPATLLWQFPTIAALASELVSPSAATAPRSPGEAMPSTAHEPIAIVGMACRLPGGVHCPEDFWRLLREGVDAVTEVPKARWSVDDYYDADPATRGKMSTRWGGFLDQVDGFDADFFSISPREAVEIDPQQRLVLELAWEALEDGGLPPRSLRGGRAGVFMGAMGSDYARLRGADTVHIEQHTGTGQDTSLIAGRLAYFLGLQGPALTVNTACSSALVAVHLACQSLNGNEAEVALAGGVNLLISPYQTVVMSKFGGMAPDGRCKAFDARANGYVRGEGGGMVVLKKLSRALADGDRIYCTIRGSAVNNDGFSNGLTAPNPMAQEAMLRDAYARAGVDPASVDYVEAHGTGTQLGDPIEAGALGAVLCADRPADRPLRIGSAKTNIGHLEAAAGIAGLIKTALALRHGELPPSLHFREPNPAIAFDALRLEVQSSLAPWPTRDGPSIAGVNSFGFSGTNCHVVVEGMPAALPIALPLAAPDRESLAARAAAFAARLAAPRPARLDALAREAAADTNGAFRSVCIARDPESMAVALVSAAERAEQAETSRSTVFVFPGHGAQARGMAHRLLETEPVFSAALAEVSAAIERHSGWSVLRELARPADQIRLDRTEIVQPLVFAFQVALAALWRSWGVRPDAVVGHSVGEVAAAHVAGILDLDDAARLIAHRGRLTAALAGGMAVVALDAESCTRRIAGGGLAFAGSNDPGTSLVTGDDSALDALLALLHAEGIWSARVPISFASHSAAVDPVREELIAALSGLQPRSGDAGFVSTVTGAILDGRECGPDYWFANLRQPVQFQSAVGRLAADGPVDFVELSPHPVFARSIAATTGGAGRLLPSLTRDVPDRATLLQSLGALWQSGKDVAWQEPSMADMLVPLSAETPAALDDRLRDVTAMAAKDPTRSAIDLAFTAACQRHHHPARAVSIAGTQADVGKVLHRGIVPAAYAPRVAMVFSGQGSQWAGMGRTLARDEPVFRRSLDDCAEALRPHTGWSLHEMLKRDTLGSGVADTAVIQPTLFALQVSLAALWRSWGIEPEIVIGHSMGEVAAAHVAGALSLDAAARIIAVRSRLVAEHAPAGAMAMAELSMADAEKLIARVADRVSVGVSNGPRNTVLSGDPEAIQSLLTQLEAKGVFCRRLAVDYASHSPQMDPLAPLLLEALQGLAPAAGAVRFHSTVENCVVAGETLDAEYWVRNLRQPVRFAEAAQALGRSGIDSFIEVSPHPVLLPAVSECLVDIRRPCRVLPSLHRERGERQTMLDSLGQLYVSGADVNWRVLLPAGARRVALPPYPWQRKRFWIDAVPTRPAATAMRRSVSSSPLGRELRSPDDGTTLWLRPVGLDSAPSLADHVVLGTPIFPAAAFAVMALQAAATVVKGAGQEIRDFVIERALAVPAGEGVTVQSSIVGSAFTVASSPAEGEAWTQHVTAVFALGARWGESLDLAASGETMSADRHYAAMETRGLSYGPAYRVVTELRRGAHRVLAGLRAASGPLDAETLDGGLQALVALAPEGECWVPTRWRRLAAREGRVAWVEARRTAANEGDVRFADAEGRVLVEIEGIRLKQVHDTAPAASLLLAREWQKLPALVAGVDDVGPCLVVGDGPALPGQHVERVQVADLQAALARRNDWRHLVYLGGLATPSCETLGAALTAGAAEATGCADLLTIVQVLAGVAAPPRLWIVTRGAERLEGDSGPVSVAAAALWGFGRTIAYEHPELRCTRLDLDAPAQLADVLGSNSQEEELALRRRTLYGARLVQRHTVESESVLRLRADATYLVTGGLGFLGLGAARLLVESGARRLLLIGRSAPTGDAATAIEALRALGAEVETVALDVGDRAALAALLEDRPVKGIVHAAGVLEDGLIGQQRRDSFERVLQGKAAGAWHLHELAGEVDFFLLLSSVTGMLGSPGQSNYTAANAFLDALARHRTALGQPALAIAFGSFEGGGLAAASAVRGERVAQRGLQPFTPTEGMAAVRRLLGGGTAEIGVARLDVRRWRAAHPQVAQSSYLASLFAAISGAEPAQAAFDPARFSTGRLGSEIERIVRREVAAVLRLEPEAVHRHAPWSALGLDSLMALELRNRLQAAFGLTLQASSLWAYPDAAALGAYLLGLLSNADMAPLAAPAIAAAPAPSSDEIAIVGMACRLPGGIDGPEEILPRLLDRVNAVTEIPRERWLALGHSGLFRDPAARWAGQLAEIDCFDARFFGIAPREARSMDPQQRLLLEVAWEALEHAGQPVGALAGRNCGVFLGIMSNDYRELVADQAADTLDAYATTGNGHSFAAGRISYALGLQGPCIAIDTACSSSLVALHLASRSLLSGESDVALTGGVNLVLSPRYMDMLLKTQALAPDGRCKTFDAQANGFVRGEGVGMLVLKRLSDAQAAGDRIWAVVAGSAVNQDGRSAGLTQPNRLAQEALVKSALASARIAPDAVGYLEAHGTGTSLGDPIEVDALRGVFGPRTDGSVCVLGSVKPNLGHLESAAGIAGVLKTVMILNEGMIPAQGHFERLNPGIALDGSPFVIPTEPIAWPRGVKPRIAGVSSFGLSGTNAHVVLREPPAPASVPARDHGEMVLPLSARSEAALRAQATRLAERIADSDAPLHQIASTLGARRDHHDFRFAAAGDRAMIVAALSAFASGEGAAGYRPPGGAPRLVFCFGNAQPTAPMDRRAFRAALEECDAAIKAECGWSAVDRLQDGGAEQEPLVALAVQLALAAELRAVGVVPDAMIGDGIGGLAAAILSGRRALRSVLNGVSTERTDPMAAFAAALTGAPTLVVGLGVDAPDESGIAALLAKHHPSARLVVDQPSLLTLLAALYTQGVDLDWSALHGKAQPPASLPRPAWQRERFWIEPTAAITPRRTAGPHALLGTAFTTARDPATRFWSGVIDTADLPWLVDHSVQGTTLLPAAAYLDMALAAMRERGGDACDLASFRFERPLSFGEKAPRRTVELSISGDALAIAHADDGGKGWTRNVIGRLLPVDGDASPPNLDLAVLQGAASEIAPGEFYARLAALGLDYGLSFRTVTRFWRGEGTGLGLVELAASERLAVGQHAIHPALLDGCFQVLAGLAPTGSTWVPAELARLRWHGAPKHRVWAEARVTESTDDRLIGTVTLCDDTGAPLLSVEGFVLRPLADGRQAQCGRHLQRAWEPLEDLPGNDMPAGRWIVVGDTEALGADLARRLEAAGPFAADQLEALAGLLARSFPEGIGCAGILHLGALDDAIASGWGSVVRTVQTLDRLPWRRAPRLVLVTRGAQAVASVTELTAPLQATLWGLARVIDIEQPRLGCLRIDLAAEPTADEAGTIVRLLRGAAGDEDEIALRAQGIFRGRLAFESSGFIAEPGPFRLRLDRAGSVDGLVAHAIRRRVPAADEVEIAVEHAGVNFRDVLATLGALPAGVDDDVDGLGVECVGRVAAVGTDVAGLTAGQRVVALGRGAFASHITLPQTLILPLPPALDGAAAASLPVAFLTAYYSLKEIARLRRGERVLIHAGSGAVGLAAIQWARHVGAEIYATAGSEGKRAFLRSCGIEHVSDSRSRRFVDDVRRWTNGEGVDVVLNSLAGDLAVASLELLRDDGRFVELGKRDAQERFALALGGGRSNLSFAIVDVLGMLERRPAVVRGMLQEIFDLVASGIFTPPPHEVFAVADYRDCLATMAQARHIGKLLLAFDDAAVRPAPAVLGRSPIVADATYLVTGGLTGLGFAAATELVVSGARHLILVGRRGIAGEAVEALRASGVDVVVAAADVADHAALAGVLASALPGRPPLRGVLHAAGVLDDAVLGAQSAERLRTVAAPKIDGTWNLHLLTIDAPLDFFVTFSSLAALIGTPGQANYAAANAYMDAFAVWRRARGLPALSINFGSISDAGLAVEHGERLLERGLESMTAQAAAAELVALLRSSPPQIGVGGLDVRQWVEFYPQAAGSALLAGLIARADTERDGPRASETVMALAALPAEQRESALADLVAETAARVLRLPPAEVQRDTPLAGQGLDSLTSLELRNVLEGKLALVLSSSLLWNYPNVQALAHHLLEVTGLADVTAAVAPPLAPEPAREDAGEIGALSDSEALARLEDELASLEEMLP